MNSKVLIVDDSRVDLEILKAIVSKAGHEVITAISGQEAVDKAVSTHPDLIFMDVIMENKDGFEACREIIANTETKHIPIVFVTGKCQKADRIWAELQGGKALVGKPFTPDEIMTEINKHI